MITWTTPLTHNDKLYHLFYTWVNVHDKSNESIGIDDPKCTRRIYLWQNYLLHGNDMITPFNTTRLDAFENHRDPSNNYYRIYYNTESDHLMTCFASNFSDMDLIVYNSIIYPVRTPGDILILQSQLSLDINMDNI